MLTSQLKDKRNSQVIEKDMKNVLKEYCWGGGISIWN